MANNKDSAKSSITSIWEDGEVAAVKALRIDRDLPRAGFLRVETVADFRDAVLSIHRGWDLGVEPVMGLLSGLAHPTQLVLTGFRDITDSAVVRRTTAKAAPSKPTYSRTDWIVTVVDTPLSIAKACAEILTDKQWNPKLIVDVTGIEPVRGRILADAFQGLVGMLNARAGRVLTAVDIADCLEWMHRGATGRLDLQLPYGSPSFGCFIRRIPDDPELLDRSDVLTKATRSIVCHVRPDSADLDAMLIETAAQGVPLGIINGALAAKRVTGFRGVSPGGAHLLANYGSVLRAVVDLTGLDQEGRRLSMKWAARSTLRLSIAAKFPDLQTAWRDQNVLRHQLGIEVVGCPASDFESDHCRYWCIKTAQVLQVAHTIPLTPTAKTLIDRTYIKPINALDAAQAWLVYSGQGVGTSIRYDPMDVPSITDWLLTNWDRFVGATFRP